MELTRDCCKGEGCGKLTYIVNKKYFLCDECNYKRIHGGKSKQNVYAERASQRHAERINDLQHNGYQSKPVVAIANIKGVFKASKIKSISDKDKFRCSDGSLVSQVYIKRKYAETCFKIKQQRPAMCQGSGRWDVPLSFSHTISQDNCKKIGKTELIWDEGNIELEGYEAPTSRPTMAHNIWEVAPIEEQIMLLNFERKLEYIKQHYPEGYNKLMVQLDDLEKKIYERKGSESNMQ